MSDLNSDSATDSDTAADPDQSAPSTSPTGADTTFEEGRYLYCAVALDGSETGSDGKNGKNGKNEEDGNSPTALGSEFPLGIEDEPIHLVSLDDPSIGVLVHPCESLYDTDEMTRLQKWLLEHQRVIDAAGERFGTPLPFRFDTVITGDDVRVREWVAEASETLVQYLEGFAGCWEYRIEVTADEAHLDEALEANDDRLGDLAARIEEASSGTSFLLDKQYEQRLTGLKRQRRAERSAALEDRLADLAREVHRLGKSGSSLLADENAESSSERTQARLGVLARGENEEAIGDVLDEVAAEAGITVTFTGPWPPYTFAPEIGRNGEGGADATH